MPFCIQCGTQNVEEARFCSKCGKQLTFSEEKSDKIVNGDAVITHSNNNVDKSTHVYQGESSGPKKATLSGERCPICGRLVKDDWFECRKCGRPHICLKHQDKNIYLCEECLQKMSQEEIEKREAEEARKRKEEERHKQNEPPKIITLKGMEFIHIPGGEFEMGDVFGDGGDNEKPVHRVELDAFYLGKYPVTFDQFDAFCDAAGMDRADDEGWSRGLRPVIGVDWDDAVSFCEWLSEETGEDVRLPTEAEWEYAARDCGKKMKWAGTSNKGDLDRYGWYDENSDDKIHPVGEKQPNGLGLYDMSGNVVEWCSDWYDEDYYKKCPSSNPQGPSSGESRVLRGGSWYSNTRNMRCTYRSYFNPLGSFPVCGSYNIGFRCARTL